MDRTKLNETMEQALNNRDYQQVMHKAAQKFRKSLDEDTVYTCQINALWHSLENFDPSRNVKFTTYLHKGVFIECVKAVKFLNRHTRLTKAKLHDNIVCNKQSGSTALVDLMDEVNTSSERDLILDRISGKTISEMAETRNVSRETVRKRMNKISHSIRAKYES